MEGLKQGGTVSKNLTGNTIIGRTSKVGYADPPVTGVGVISDLEPPRTLQVLSEMGYLSNSIAQLTERVATLQNRLSPLLCDKDTGKVEEATIEQPLAPLAGDIREQRAEVLALVWRVNFILERLEI